MRPVSIIAATIVASLIGCGDGHERDEVVPLDKVPARVTKAAVEKLPGVTFETAWKEKTGGQDAYEIRGKTKEGKVRDCKVAADGNVLEVD